VAVSKPKKIDRDKQAADRRSITEWNVKLKNLGLPQEPKKIMRRSRRAEPLLDEDSNEIERAAARNLDGSALVPLEETEIQLAVTRGAFLKLSEYLKLSGIERTVLALRLLNDSTRENIRAYFLRERPLQVSEAMTAWRDFSRRMPEIMAFLAGLRQYREIPAKRIYRLSE
jgi:hypothetical protein